MIRNNSYRASLVLLGASLLITSPALWAEDIDIFAAGAGSEGGVANIVMLLDNGANFAANVVGLRCSIHPTTGAVDTSGAGAHPTALDGTAAAVEQCALYSALKKLQSDAASARAANARAAEFNIAVMGFNATGMRSYNAASDSFSQSCVGNTGGCLMLPFTRFNATNAPRVLEWIRKWAKSTAAYGANYVITSNNSANGAVMQEAWAYLNGRTGVSGRNYANVAPPSQCGGKSIIFVGNAYRNNNAPGDLTNEANSPRLPLFGQSATALKNASPPATDKQRQSITGSLRTSCSASNVVLETAEGRGAYALNWAAYLRAQGTNTYSIGVLGPTCNAEYAAHLEKLGSQEVGGGGYFPTNNFNELNAAFSTAINSIIAVNTAFASVSLPVSVNTQGSYLNQVFVGQFRPDENFRPRWYGNLKQYRLAMIDNQLRTVDATGTPAINPQTGFISGCARSFWTPATADDYWSEQPRGDCSPATEVSNSPDGNIVEKGAQAHWLRQLAPANRVVRTCAPGDACTTLTSFDDANTAVTASLLGASGAAQRTNLINWARGLNDRNGDAELVKPITAMRPSVHGDVVHSRPVAVNYGTDDQPSVVVFYGGNDGMLRAVAGSQGATQTLGGATVAAGAELWTFLPPEFYGRIKRLYDNAPSITLPGAPDANRAPKDYGVDGAITAYQGTVAGTPRKLLFVTLRRGGRVIYAFDVTNPLSPSLLWRLGCPNLGNDTGCSTGFSGLGQTWSSLKPMIVEGYSTASALVIAGGGYDRCEDTDSITTVAGVTTRRNHSCTAASKGNKIYVIDAVAGTLVKAFDTDRAVIGEVTLVRDGAGRVTMGYAADLGGNVYRLRFAGASAAWTIRKIAALGCDDPAQGDCSFRPSTRKFMFAPSVVTADDGVTYSILLGSGDREKPTADSAATRAVANHFFMLQDRPGDASWLDAEATAAGCGLGNALLCRDSLAPITAGIKPTDAALSAKKGWYLGLTSGEQVVTSALTLFGVTTFSTSQAPLVNAETCRANLGTTRVYNINYLNAFSASNEALPYGEVAGGGLPPSPVGGQVKLEDGRVVSFCIGCRTESPLESQVAPEPSTSVKPLNRVFWFLRQ